jgi:DNA-binding MarR family transcriptional regulator
MFLLGLTTMVSPNHKDIEKRYDLRILKSFRRIIRAIDTHSRKLLTNFNITAPQLLCLLTIAEDGPLTSAELSQKVHLSRSTIVGIMDRLQQKDLIERTRSSQDRRRVYLTTTEAGRRVTETAPSPLQDKLAEALKSLPELEQATIALSLERVVKLMEVEHRVAAPILETGPILPDDCGPAAQKDNGKAGPSREVMQDSEKIPDHPA